MSMLESTKKPGGAGLSGAVKMIVRFFLEPLHFRQLYQILSEEWAGTHSMTAAVRLMESHGAHITHEEQLRLAELPEERMIDAFICKLPQQSREQFEQFFLQLSLIATSTTRLRRALELGDVATIEDVLESAENVGIISFILKMALAQAGTEAKNKDLEAEEFLEATSRKIGPFLQSQAEAMHAKQALAQASAQFGACRAEANAKSKKFLMTMSSGSADVIQTAVFTTWADHTKRMKREDEIRKQYEVEIDAALKKLHDYKMKQVERIRHILMKDVESAKGALLQNTFDAFKEEVFDAKNKQSMGKSVQQFQDQLDKFANASKGNAKALLARMNAGTDEALIDMCFKCFVQFCEDYKKNKEIEDAVKAAEKKVQEFLDQHKEGAKGVLNRMSQGTDAGLVGSMFKEWKDVVAEEKQGNAMQEALSAKASKFDAFANRNSGTALSEMQRMASVTDMHLTILVHNLWKREIKCDKIRRYGKDKNIKKRNQLMGVKTLFKNFATDLDAGLKSGTPRTEGQRKSVEGPKVEA